MGLICVCCSENEQEKNIEWDEYYVWGKKLYNYIDFSAYTLRLTVVRVKNAVGVLIIYVKRFIT